MNHRDCSLSKAHTGWLTIFNMAPDGVHVIAKAETTAGKFGKSFGRQTFQTKSKFLGGELPVIT
jgi:hypothetical protein